ncbi:MAG TPA: carboxymuconolactone decarboxylase family protein [Myxococcota bacterium]|nr:carboxymuconolactone decarboxylase family protein [Myxococcota bacterium]
MIAPRVQPPATTSSDPIQASPLALQPELLAAFLRLYGTLWSHGEVDQATKELARIRNARLVDCPICKAIRFAGARREGLTEETLDRVRDDWRTGPLGPREKAVLGLVDAVVADSGALHAAGREALLAHFTPAQVVELAAGVALFMGFSKIAVALGGLPDEIPVHEQPTPDVPAGSPAAPPAPSHLPAAS